MIKITTTAKNTKDGEGWVIDGHTEIETRKEFVAAEMSGILIEMWRANKEAFCEAMDIFMEYMKNE